MSPRTLPADLIRQSATERSWQRSLREAVRDPAELAALLDLPLQWLAGARRATKQFPLFVPRAYLTRIRPGDPHDPLLRQVLPIGTELDTVPDFTADPVGERQAETSPGLLHKYHGRVLMVTTGACAVHCRYCFRRHYPYSEAPKSLTAWQSAIKQIAADDSVHEVIVSGGDPLTLADATLAALAEQLADIPHVKRLRVHTRVPIVIPDRVTGELIAWLTSTRLTPIIVVHINHPREIDRPVATALGTLVDAGVPVLNQAVLLAGVNDDADVLVELCETLVNLRVMPYYLHQLDRVAGAAHFEVPEHVGLAIMDSLRARLPGYAVPRYVTETAGAASKIEI